MASSTRYDSDCSLQSIDLGCFKIQHTFETDDEEMNDSFDELISQRGMVLEQITASDNNKDLKDMMVALNNTADECLTPSESPSKIPTEDMKGDEIIVNSQQRKRFKAVTDEELKKIESSAQSENTKRNTLWGVWIFQDWSTEVYGEKTDLQTIMPQDLSKKLTKCYCEARPKGVEKRATSLPVKQAELYHKNTLINIRAAVNRHLQNIDREIDLVKDKEFKTCNKTLSGLLKQRMKDGSSRPTQHKEILPQTQLLKIASYFKDADRSAVKLRQAVWYQLAVHFVSRGLEFHKQLRVDSFDFAEDDYGKYVCLNHKTKQKNYQGRVSKTEDTNEKKMYATGEQNCPVALLKLLINKTDPSAQMLFNQFNKATKAEDEIWYVNKPLCPRSFTNFMPDICKAAGADKFTAHCLRATAITAMNDSGHEARHIMFMSGHRSESAIRSYNRSCTDAQKKAFSDTLSALSCGNNIQKTNIDCPGKTPATAVSLPAPHDAVAKYDERSALNSGTSNTCTSISSNFTSTGMLTNSVFNSCTFNFTHS